MVKQIPVSVHEENGYAFFKSEQGLLIKISNSVLRDQSKYWSTQESSTGKQYVPDTNEGKAKFTITLDGISDDSLVDTGGHIDVIETIDGEKYIIGYSNAVPAYSPFYLANVETDSVYKVHTMVKHKPYDDTVLDMELGDDDIIVENVESGLSKPFEKDVVYSKIGDELQYALPILMD